MRPPRYDGALDLLLDLIDGIEAYDNPGLLHAAVMLNALDDDRSRRSGAAYESRYNRRRTAAGRARIVCVRFDQTLNPAQRDALVQIREEDDG